MSQHSIREIQEKILEIVVYFDSFCKKHGIEYYLMDGSALGAARHQGFIPWDDDFDVFMTYENYAKWLTKANEINKEKFYSQIEGTAEWPMMFSKLRMHGTTFIEEDTRHRKMHKGLYIDVMCLNNMSNSRIIRLFQFMAARIVTAKTIFQRGYTTKNKKKLLFMSIIKTCVGERGKRLLVNFIRMYNNKRTQYVGHLFGRAPFSKAIYPKKYLGRPKLVQFEDLLLPVPENNSAYLSVRYGKDFMELPSQEVKDSYPAHSAFVDLNKDYLEYT